MSKTPENSVMRRPKLSHAMSKTLPWLLPVVLLRLHGSHRRRRHRGGYFHHGARKGLQGLSCVRLRRICDHNEEEDGEEELTLLIANYTRGHQQNEVRNRAPTDGKETVNIVHHKNKFYQ